MRAKERGKGAIALDTLLGSPSPELRFDTCPECLGAGEIPLPLSFMPVARCEECFGTGEVPPMDWLDDA